MNPDREQRVRETLEAKSAAVARARREGDAQRAAACRPPNPQDLLASVVHPILREYEVLLNAQGWRAFADGDPPSLCVKRPDDREASIRFLCDGQTVRVERRLSHHLDPLLRLNELSVERLEDLLEKFIESIAV